ncbi:MAG TPA: hypothetical protein VG095_03330 [Chthoniobacterales bacterium]|nr:hypothetical protein [Chthoniobacterales bacterium]
MNSTLLAHAREIAPGTTNPPAEELTAREYERIHARKVMIIDRRDGRPLATSDFFQIEAVGTHPTGLIVTGNFENARRSHMMASAVRVADTAEVEWLQARQN